MTRLVLTTPTDMNGSSPPVGPVTALADVNASSPPVDPVLSDPSADAGSADGKYCHHVMGGSQFCLFIRACYYSYHLHACTNISLGNTFFYVRLILQAR